MKRSRKQVYREAEDLPIEEARDFLVEWRRQQNRVVSDLLEWWRKASPAERQRLPWYWEEGEGGQPTLLRSRDGELLLRVARVPSGELVLVWALSAGTLGLIEETLQELRSS
jgi:hypothetical protein